MIISRGLVNAAAAVAVGITVAAQSTPTPRGVQDPAWAPDGKRLAFSYLDRIWLSSPDGRNGKALRPETTDIEREPAWSPDGKSIALAADRGRGFDILVVPVEGGRGAPFRAIASLDGDERWPSRTADGRIVFSHRPPGGRSRLYAAPASGGDPKPLFTDTQKNDERHGCVSPDGKRIAYVSDRDSEDSDADLWVAELTPGPRDRVTRTRLVRVRGIEGFPTWAPDSSRVAFYAVREGAGSVWVLSADNPAPDARRPRSAAATGRATGARVATRRRARLVAGRQAHRDREPAAARANLQRKPRAQHGRSAAPVLPRPMRSACGWSTRRFRLTPARERSPRRLRSASSSSVRSRLGNAATTLLLDRIDSGRVAGAQREASPAGANRTRRGGAGNSDRCAGGRAAAHQAGSHLGSSRGRVGSPACVAGRGFGPRKRGQHRRCGDRRFVRAWRGRAGRSGIGGDGMALLYLKGMAEPIAIDYKDQTPIRATRDNPLLTASTGDGASAANIPGVVAGLDLLYRRYGSKAVPWSDLIAPAIEYAEEGYELDAALPTTIAEGRRFFEKYPTAARIYLPGGKVPAPGDRFVNKDYAATLRAIARDGADAFYRGSVARRITDDMGKNGGLITLDDLAQYRAIERRPLAGRYREHAVYSAPPPVSTGAALIETLQILQNYQPRSGAT